MRTMIRLDREILRFGLAVVAALITLSQIVALAQVPVKGASGRPQAHPYGRQVAEQIDRLASASGNVRAAAAEALGFLRAYQAADPLQKTLADESPHVRREAAMSLAWCGGRPQIGPLLHALDDRDWTVRQAACVALNNLTGMEWPYDALSGPQQRNRQAAVWRGWWADASKQHPPADVLALLDDPDLERRLRGVRALGALGGPHVSRAIVKLIGPYRAQDYGKVSPLQRHMVQAALRSLGRLSDPEALPELIAFLDTVGWARYAADALGEFGDPQAIAPLIATYPRFAWGLKREPAKVFPRDDSSSSGMSPEDRMYETPYAVSVALSRLPWDDPRDVEALRGLVPLLAANLPSDWDGGMLYEPEAFEFITAYLLDRAGLRRAACEAAFRAAALHRGPAEPLPQGNPREGLTPEQNLAEIAMRRSRDVPWFAGWLPALCRDGRDVPRLIRLLTHDNGWVRINAAKALMFMGAEAAVEPLANLLAASKTEAEHGYSGVREHAEYNDPAPRWREAFVRALGRLGTPRHAALLIKILEDDRNVVDVRHAAALALDELGSPQSVAALKRAVAEHPFHSVRLVAREAIWRRGIRPEQSGAIRDHASKNSSHLAPRDEASSRGARRLRSQNRPKELDAVVFIKGDQQVHSDFNAQSGIDPWRQTYTITNSGPTYRRGRNLYLLGPAAPDGKVTQLTHFEDGYVSTCEVSWDGRRVIFARRADGDDRWSIDVGRQERSHVKLEHEPRPDSDPWWHVWEINVDGTALRQITDGPYHDVQPAYLPDGRIVFSSTRIGVRDEYHGYPASGLTVMNADGSDIHCIGFNLGGDREPALLDDGRIVYTRLDLFYSRLKTEFTVQAVFPDGHNCVTLYGPERREFWRQLNAKVGEQGWSESPPRHRVLRLTQPQPFDDGRVICASSGGLTLIGPGRYRETIIPHDKNMAVTSPFPLGGGRVLCAAAVKRFKTKQGDLRDAAEVDLGLYLLDAHTGEMSLLYNDPDSADFDARPIAPRPRPPVRAEKPRSQSYTARLLCNSVSNTQFDRVRSRGKLIRVIEGMPVVSRHQTQQNHPGNRWRNHGGTHARVLGTAPLAADGSFFAEVPADRLIHLQVLDSDRQVVGNQLIWMYARPGEMRSCIGCHEKPDTVQLSDRFPPVAETRPIRFLPNGGEFTYRAKAWRKGILPDEAEERGRTVRAVNLIGRQ